MTEKTSLRSAMVSKFSVPRGNTELFTEALQKGNTKQQWYSKKIEIRYYKVVLKEIFFTFHNEKVSLKMKTRSAFHILYL